MNRVKEQSKSNGELLFVELTEQQMTMVAGGLKQSAAGGSNRPTPFAPYANVTQFDIESWFQTAQA